MSVGGVNAKGIRIGGTVMDRPGVFNACHSLFKTGTPCLWKDRPADSENKIVRGDGAAIRPTGVLSKIKGKGGVITVGFPPGCDTRPGLSVFIQPYKAFEYIPDNQQRGRIV